jgi:hypothetical protein
MLLLERNEGNREIKGISKQINPTKASQVENINMGRGRTQCIPYKSSKKKQASGGKKCSVTPLKSANKYKPGKLENPGTQAKQKPGDERNLASIKN